MSADAASTSDAGTQVGAPSGGCCSAAGDRGARGALIVWLLVALVAGRRARR